MGLDHALVRRETPKNELEIVIKALDYDDNDDEGEHILRWRKDYTLNDFMCDMCSVENCECVYMTKEMLKQFLIYLEKHNGEEDYNWDGEYLNYDDEIKVVRAIIKNFGKDNYSYYYWAWW